MCVEPPLKQHPFESAARMKRCHPHSRAGPVCKGNVLIPESKHNSDCVRAFNCNNPKQMQDWHVHHVQTSGHRLHTETWRHRLVYQTSSPSSKERKLMHDAPTFVQHQSKKSAKTTWPQGRRRQRYYCWHLMTPSITLALEQS